MSTQVSTVLGRQFVKSAGKISRQVCHGIQEGTLTWWIW